MNARENERIVMARSTKNQRGGNKSSKRNQRRRKAKSSVVGNIMMEVLAVAAFLALLSASKDYSNVDSTKLADKQPLRTAEYSSMLQGYFSDQFQRHGVFQERR